MPEPKPQPTRYEPWLSPAAPSHEAGGSPPAGAESAARQLGYSEAIREALSQAMHQDQRVFVMGQDVDAPNGMFGCTRDLHRDHGPGRSFDIPLSETAMMGVAVGAAMAGMRPVYFHNRPDFLILGADQLINHAAKWHYMFGGQVNVPLVVWACTGRGWGSGAQHSQAVQGLFLHVPGLKLVMPSTPYDAKGLLLAALAEPNPVLVLEHRLNFRQRGPVPEDMYRVPIGKGVIRRPGRDVSILTLSHLVQEAMRAAETLAREDIEAEVVDLRSLRPLDEALILESVARTGRAVVADCGWKTGGTTAEVTAVLAEKGFASLRAPVRRVACADCPTPAGYTLEAGFYVGEADLVREARLSCQA